MRITLDPPSGYPNSYYDVKFVIELSDSSESISLTNKTTGQTLYILAVNEGYIRDDFTIVVDGAKTVEGYINLFNDDKNNKTLEMYTSIEIECESSSDKASAIFYNEAKSADSGIVPFELQIHNPVVNMESNDPLRLSLVSDEEKKVELCIRSQYGLQQCTIEVICKQGITNIDIPSEFIASDLDFASVFQGKYTISYVNFQGRDLNGFVNRQYIPIRGAVVEFSSNKIGRKPTERFAPDNTILSEDFVLSDRYFVHTFKDFSSYGRRMENVPLICNMPRFLHEIIDMRSVAAVKKTEVISTPPDYSKKNMLFRYANSKSEYRKFFKHMSAKLGSVPKLPVNVASSASKSGGCGCSRKHK